MIALRRSILALLSLTSLLVGGCAPATSLPGPSPTGTAAPILAATPTQTPSGVTTPAAPQAHLDEIFMMDATSGWARAFQEIQGNSFLRTSDGGQTWTSLRLQEYVTPESRPYLFFPLDARTAWVILGEDTLISTSDGGETWQLVNRDLRGSFVVPYHDWYALRFADASHGWLEVGYSAAGAHEYYYETRDGGVTWQPLNFASWPADLYSQRNHPNELAFWTPIDVIYYDSSRFMIARAEQEGTLKLFQSTDWGKSWRTVQLPGSAPAGQPPDPHDRHISHPAFFDGRNGVLTVTVLHRDTNATQLFVYGTSDGGLTWTLVGEPSFIDRPHSQISFLTTHDWVLICGAQFCATHDGGRTWQAFDFGAPLSTHDADTYYQLDFIDPNTGWLLEAAYPHQGAAANIRLLKTTDGGATWTELSGTIRP